MYHCIVFIFHKTKVLVNELDFFGRGKKSIGEQVIKYLLLNPIQQEPGFPPGPGLQ